MPPAAAARCAVPSSAPGWHPAAPRLRRCHGARCAGSREPHGYNLYPQTDTGYKNVQVYVS
eukprot:6822356-Prymnesium_polylepis.1